MKNEAEHHGIEPEPRARPCPSAIDGMLHIYRIVSGIALIDFERSIKGELLDLASGTQSADLQSMHAVAPIARGFPAAITFGHFVKAVTLIP